MTAQIALFDDIETESRFERFDRENPDIYKEFKRFTFEAIRSGRKNYSARAVIHRVRWETSVKGNDEFKVNNDYTPFYAP